MASSRSKLNGSDADVWDSGKISSDQSTTVEFGGSPLDADQSYYWTVRVWDEEGATSPWSSPARFTTAIPEEQWHADWIRADLSDPENQLLGTDWTDYSFETELTIQNNATSLVFRASDEDNLYMWQLALDSYGAVNADQHLLRPHIKQNGSFALLDEIPIGDALADAGELNTVRITTSGSEISTTINGETVDTRTDDTHPDGTIGFRHWGGEQAAYDTVQVTTPDEDVLFADDFADGERNHFSGGTVRDDHLHFAGDGIVVPYVDLPDFPRQNPDPLLRTEFTIEKNVEDARLHISGLGFYELYLNGDRVGDRVLDTARTNYEETVLYSTYDVTEQVVNNTNAIGVALGRGRPGEPDARTPPSWRSDPVLRLQLKIKFEDGTTTTVGSAETWAVTDGPTRWDSLRPGQEFYDAREEQPGWTTVGFDDSEWQSASEAGKPPGKLTPQRVQPIKVHETIEPVDMWEPKPGVYVYDLGQMIAGWPELRVEGDSGTKVTLREGEKLSADGTVEEIRYSSADCLWQEYILDGDGKEAWEPRFTYGGFRYVQIEGFPGTPSPETVRGKAVHTAVDTGEAGSFASSNDLLNQIHENTRWAMLNNLHGQHTDSPTWEKLGWTETNIELAETLSANFSMTRFWEKFLRDCRDSQFEDGDIPYVVPHEGVALGGFGYRNDPGWDAATVITAWHAYQYTGDLRLLADHYESMKRYVQYVQANAENGTIVRTGLGDYVAPGGGPRPPEGPAIVSTGCYYRATELLAESAALLGHPDEAAEFDDLRREIGAAFNDEFFDSSANVYCTGEVDGYRQTSNLYPLAFDIVPESRREAVAANLAHDVRVTHDGHLNTGAHGLRHLFPVLTEHGYHDLAYTVATQTTYPSWGYWLENDVTALLERWNLDARSRTHDFLGSVDEWFYQYLAGIRRPVEPGFKEIDIAPELTDGLDWARASMDTVRGTIASEWERTETSGNGRTRDGLTLDTTIPGNATATVRIPTLGGDKVRVRESGDSIWNNGNRTGPGQPGVSNVERDGDVVVVEVGSGEYAFELEQLGGGSR